MAMHETQTFSEGALWGLEQYSAKYAAVGTFESPAIAGFLAGCTSNTEFTRGALHGLALGARYHVDTMLRVVEMRNAEREGVPA